MSQSADRLNGISYLLALFVSKFSQPHGINKKTCSDVRLCLSVSVRPEMIMMARAHKDVIYKFHQDVADQANDSTTDFFALLSALNKFISPAYVILLMF